MVASGQSQAGSLCHLFEDGAGDFFPVGGEKLEVVDADLLAVAVGPHDLLVSCHFHEFGCVHVGSAARVAGDDDVPIWQHLGSAGVLQPCTGKVFVGQRPDDFATGVEVNDSVPVRAANQGLPVTVTDRGEGPRVNFVLGIARHGGVQLAENLALVVIMKDGEIQEVRHQVGSIGKLASHPSLHVMVLLLAGQREIQNHFTGGTDLEQSGVVARFRDDKRAVGGWLSAVDFALGAFPNQRLFSAGSDLDDGSSAMTFGFVDGQDDRAIVEHVTIACCGRIGPTCLAVRAHQVGLLTASQEAVGDVLSLGRVARDGAAEHAAQECDQSMGMTHVGSVCGGDLAG